MTGFITVDLSKEKECSVMPERSLTDPPVFALRFYGLDGLQVKVDFSKDIAMDIVAGLSDLFRQYEKTKKEKT